MIKLLIFDSNNTIEDYNSYEDKRSEVMEMVGQEFNIRSLSIISHFTTFQNKFGNKPWDYYPIFWKDLIEVNKLSLDFTEIYKVYIDYYSDEVQIFDDFLNIVHQLHKKYKLSIIANGYDDRLKMFIKKSNLSKYFDCIISSGETPSQKPDSFLFKYVLNKMNCLPEETVMIGDKYETDIKGANNLGINTIRIKRSNDIAKIPSSLNSIPDFSIDSLSELLNILHDYKKFKYRKHRNQPIHIEKLKEKIDTAIILAGGNGKRMMPLTKNTQKCMLKILHKPILEILIDFLKDAGVENIVIVTNHFSETIKSYFGNGHVKKLNISYVTGNFETTYDAVKYATKKINSKSFYYCHGNILFNPSLIRNLYIKYISNNRNTISIIKNDAQITHVQFSKDKGSFTPVFYGFSEYVFTGLAIYNTSSFITVNNIESKNGMTEEIILRHYSNNINFVLYDDNFYHFERVSDYENVKNKSINHLLLRK